MMEQMRIEKELTGDVRVGKEKNNQEVIPLYIAERRKEQVVDLNTARRHR